MTKMTLNITKALAALGMVAAASSSHALILAGQGDFQGTGLGAVNTVLTLTSPANSTNETASVSWNGSTSVITGDALTGASQTQSRTLGSLGVTSPSNLRIVLNAAEPQNEANVLTVNSLALTIFSPTGTTLFTSDTFGPRTLTANEAGIGNSGFVFQLSAAEIARASGAFAANNVLGLSASLANATGGPETFYAVNFAGGGGAGNGGGGGGAGNAVPEPGTVAIFGAGLAALALMRRRRA